MTTEAWQEYIRKQNEAWDAIPEEYRKLRFDDSESTGYHISDSPTQFKRPMVKEEG